VLNLGNFAVAAKQILLSIQRERRRFKSTRTRTYFFIVAQPKFKGKVVHQFKTLTNSKVVIKKKKKERKETCFLLCLEGNYKTK